jgi:hypothetical protein
MVQPKADSAPKAWSILAFECTLLALEGVQVCSVQLAVEGLPNGSNLTRGAGMGFGGTTPGPAAEGAQTA